MAVTEKQTATAGIWGINVRQIVYAALGAALYGLLSIPTNIFQISAGGISFRPAIVIPLFFGALFGPWVGLFAGGFGNILGDWLTGWGITWNWDIGNGLIGFVPGLAIIFTAGRYFNWRNYAWAEGLSIVGILIGVGFSAYSDIWVAKKTVEYATFTNFIPGVIADLICGLILLPILLVAYGAAVRRIGRS
ncbi:MAG: ECF transporter S component [Ktedonobacteraceae bacterium]|nr:ECF transporter S component [Ktedonobacteraceae bacterium]